MSFPPNNGFPPALIALIVALGLLLAGPAAAQDWGDDVSVEHHTDEEPEPQPERPRAEEPEEQVRPQERARPTQREIHETVQRQIQTGQHQIHIYQLAEEMIDEVIADVSTLNVRAFSPVAFRTMNLTPNLSAQFGEFVESTLITALATHTDVTVKRCVACNSMRSRVEDGDWVVTMGLVHQEELVAEAERIGAKAFLDARFSFFPGTNIVAMQVEIFRADDGAVLWTETYRSDATTAAILRTGDRVVSRSERVRELERKLEARPYYGHILYGGAGYIPYDSPLGGLAGATIGYRLYERFGPDLRYSFGVGAEGFANFSENGILGTFVHGTFQVELFQRNLNQPTFRTGPAVGGFFAGTEGNSFYAEWGFDAVMQFRLGAGASLFYFMPTEFAGFDLGGLGWKARATFNW